MKKIIPIIMSGGSGTRLWPLSTSKKPKQFHALHGSHTMIQDTVLRFGDPIFTRPVVICGESHLNHVTAQLEAIGQAPEAVILEPMARNTAAVAAIAALYGARSDPDALMILAPADHVITKVDAFAHCIRSAVPLAQTKIVTFGISPTKPETGFGYIEQGAALGDGLFEIVRFLEKPDYVTAQSYVRDGKHAWNAGIFLFSARVMLEALEAFAPEVLRCARAAFSAAQCEEGLVRLDAAEFSKTPSISVDYAVMEKTRESAVIPCDIGWADLGSFAELYNFAPKDDDGNYTQGKVAMIDARQCLVRTHMQPVAVIGLDQVMVIVTDEGVLVAPIDRAQDVKKGYEALRS